MKISYRTHPALEKLQSGKLGRVGLLDCDKGLMHPDNSGIVENMKSNFAIFSPYFKQNIEHISNAFGEACHKAQPKMMVDDLWNNVGIHYGVYLFQKLTIFYSVDSQTETPGIHNHLIFIFEGDVLVLYSIQNTPANVFFCWISNQIIKLYEGLFLKAIAKGDKVDISTKEKFINEVDNHYYSMIVSLINFTRYAETETKILTPKQKEKGIACKYVNNTLFKIKFLDSKWFTTLVKSDAFKVRGHFRLQPCGQGMKDRKLIWINDFQKEGYTAPARKLSADV